MFRLYQTLLSLPTHLILTCSILPYKRNIKYFLMSGECLIISQSKLHLHILSDTTRNPVHWDHDLHATRQKYSYYLLFQTPIRETARSQPRVRKNILIKSKRHKGSLRHLEPGLILTLTKIHPRIEVLACRKQAQSSH
jgi:hypothetical protein